MKLINSQIAYLKTLNASQLKKEADEMRVSNDIVKMVVKSGKIPVPNFAAGGIATPADASLMMQLGAESVFVGSGIFKSNNPLIRAKAVVDSVTYFDKADVISKVSTGLGEGMKGIDFATMEQKDFMQTRSS